MRQLLQDLRSGEVEVVELPDPSAGPGQVLVRTAHSLISPGTEQAITRTASRSLVGKAMERPDQARKVLEKVASDGVGPTMAAVRARLDDSMTPGYSSAGVVEQVGPGVEGLKPGDRVACVGANAAVHAERVAMPAPLCLRLPDGVALDAGAFGAVGAIAAHGLRIAAIEPGHVVAVIGMGLVGQLAAQLATAGGARVLAVDISPERTQLATGLGAVAGALPADAAEAVSELTGGAGADAVIVAAATKTSEPIALAAELARDRATVSVIGDVGLDVPRRPFYDKELVLRVSRSYGPGRYDDAYELEGRDYPIGYVRWTERRLIGYFFEEVAAGRVRLEELVTHRFEIAAGAEAYGALADPSRMAILLRYPERAEPGPAAPAGRMDAALRPGAAGALRVGLIGPGLFARSTLLPALARGEAELVSVAARTPARAFSVARRWARATAVADAGALLDDDRVDAVIVATRHGSHADLAARALERGKGVFLEKPLAVDEAGLARVAPLLAAGGRLVVDFNRDAAALTGRVREHFAGRSDPITVNYRVNAGFLEPSHWLRDREQGGGRLVGEGCHFVQLCSTLVDRRLVSVAVRGLGAGPRTLPGDSFVLTLDYDDGSVAVITYVASGPKRLAKERVEVLGAGRSAVLEDFRRLSLLPGTKRPGDRLSVRQDKGHAALLGQALDFFRAGGEPPIAYERILETTAATLVARDALERGDSSPVPLVSG